MANASHAKKRVNRQHAAKGESFMRVASDFRRRSRDYVAKWNQTPFGDSDRERYLIIGEMLEQCAEVCATEGKTVRKLR